MLLWLKMMIQNVIVRFFQLVVLVMGALSSEALDLTKIDLSHRYDPDSPVKMEYRVIEKGGQMTVFFLIQSDSMAVWEMEFMQQRGYTSDDHSVLNPEINFDKKSDKFWRGKFTFRPQKDFGLLIVKLSRDFNFYFDIPLENGNLPFSSFAPMNDSSVIMHSYLKSQNIKWSEDQLIQVYQYPNRFGPADAPMEEMKALAPILNEDSVFFFDPTVTLHDYNLYYFKDDTLADIGLSLFKTPPYFPNLRKIRELIPPMKYVTTEAEYRTLLRSTRPKKTFDEFWINTYGTKFRARNAIRKYFKSVENANAYFTSIKEGWKTDQGMIFIVYGTPIEMYRDGRTETWIYEQEEFEFIKVSTLFGPIFALRKDRKYEKDWYKRVGDLRRGD